MYGDCDCKEKSLTTVLSYRNCHAAKSVHIEMVSMTTMTTTTYLTKYTYGFIVLCFSVFVF